jgi:hypothetical protein
MKIKEAVNETCGECGRYNKEKSSPEIYGCDTCRKEMQGYYLRMTVFYSPLRTRSEEKQFCSWKCVLAYLPKIKSDYFADLPYMHFDADYPEEMTGKALINLLRRKK